MAGERSADASSGTSECGWVLLVPYQDTGGASRTQLQRLVTEMMQRLPQSAFLCVLEQSRDQPVFNRGQLLNAGFASCAARGYATLWSRPAVVVLQDANVAASQETLALYASPTVEDPVRLFSASLHRYSTIGSFGCAVSMRTEAFESANGFPNTFWGHGGEDGAFQCRLRKASVGYSQHYGAFQELDPERTSEEGGSQPSIRSLRTGDSSMSMHELRQRITTDKRRWRGDGLSQVAFSVASERLLERDGCVFGVHLVLCLEAQGLRCGKCLQWRPEAMFSNQQAHQRGPAEKSICKSCLASEYSAIEANVARNSDESRRACSKCDLVLPSRSQLFKHVAICGQDGAAQADAATCIPCASFRTRRPVSPGRAARVLAFVERLRAAAGDLPTGEARSAAPGSEAVLRRLLASQALTFQSKETNVVQIKALLACVQGFAGGTIVEFGAGKALLTRAIYEVLERTVPVVALDNRLGGPKDAFYDPLNVAEGQAPYSRVVADVRDPAWASRAELRGPVMAVSKHLCGGATDCSLERLFDLDVVAVCMAPCCHQKLAYEEYCNLPFLEAIGFGSRNEFRQLLFLVQLSKHDALKEHEYLNRAIVDLMPFTEIKALGRLARRLLEEGRAAFLRDRGFAVEVCQYVGDSVTPDNLVILGRRPTKV